jgi:hypothetical protein
MDHIRVFEDIGIGRKDLLVLHGVTIIVLGDLAQGFTTFNNMSVVYGIITNGNVRLDISRAITANGLDLVPNKVLFIGCLAWPFTFKMPFSSVTLPSFMPNCSPRSNTP